MTTYHMHEGTFSAPEGWRDQSMTVLRAPAKGRNKEAAIVITRDYETPLSDPEEYADAQQKTAKESFPGFKSLGRRQITLAGQPAAMVDYQWLANGSVPLRQRQAYVHHEGAMLTFTASAQASEFGGIEDAWTQLISSLKLLSREDEPGPAATDAVEAALPHVFALSARDRQLVVYASDVEAAGKVDPFEVEDAGWTFFASDGRPLKATFEIQNRRGVFKPRPGRFVLVPDTAGVEPHLNTRLERVSAVKGLAPFDSTDDIASHLRANAPPPPPDSRS